MPSDLIRDRTGAAPYVTPFLDALDRMQERRFVSPDRLTERAESLLVEILGAHRGRPEAAFAHGCTGLLGEHTHYFNGFALLLSLPLGTAAAIRPSPSERSRVVFEGSRETWSFDAAAGFPAGAPVWVRVVIETIRSLVPPGSQVDVAVVSTVPSSCVDAYVAALGISTARACQAAFALSQSGTRTRQLVRRAVESGMAWPFGIGYLIAADEGRPDHFSLIDAETLERLPVEVPSREVLGWGLVDTGVGALRDSRFHRDRKALADEAVGLLRERGFGSITSLRELEHRDLKAALSVIPARLRPIVRHLVTENRRVQKLVAAVRRRDWQMFGALLLMSHASVQKDWEGSNDVVDLAVQEAEAMSLEGIYGACMTSRGGAVLVVGRPFIVPQCLDRVQDAVKEQCDVEANVLLL